MRRKLEKILPSFKKKEAQLEDNNSLDERIKAAKELVKREAFSEKRKEKISLITPA